MCFQHRTAEALDGALAAWRDHLGRHRDLDPRTVAPSLALGRAALPHRFAAVVDDAADLAAALADPDHHPRAFRSAAGGGVPPAPTGTTAPGDAVATAWHWVAGHEVDWRARYPDPAPPPPGLPTYAFERRSYWIDQPAAPTPVAATEGTVGEPDDEPRAVGGPGPGVVVPLASPPAGFSISRGLRGDPASAAVLGAGRAALRSVLLAGVPMDRVRAVLVVCVDDPPGDDPGDVAAIAEAHPHLVVHGLSDDPARTRRANAALARRGLADRALVFDGTAAGPFPATYDLAVGVETALRGADLDAVLAALDVAVVDGGWVVLADQVAHGRGDLVDPASGVRVRTTDGWVRALARHHLAVDEVVDASTEVAAALDDPQGPDGPDGPGALRDRWRTFLHQGRALRERWTGWWVWRLRVDGTAGTDGELARRAAAAERAVAPTPWAEAVGSGATESHARV